MESPEVPLTNQRGSICNNGVEASFFPAFDEHGSASKGHGLRSKLKLIVRLDSPCLAECCPKALQLVPLCEPAYLRCAVAELFGQFYPART